MSDYLVSHPEIDIAAKVTDAPSTEKARTAFLDFLERSGRIPRNQRQYYRKGMATKRERLGMDTAHDIEIDYKYETPQEGYSEIQPPAVGEIPLGEQEDLYSDEKGRPLSQVEMDRIAAKHPTQLESPIAKIGKELSPIEKISLGRSS